MFLEKTEVLGMPALVGGSGEILLFLHGFLSCKESFIKQLSFFENYFKVVNSKTSHNSRGEIYHRFIQNIGKINMYLENKYMKEAIDNLA